MELLLSAPLGDVITDEGRVNAQLLAKAIGISVPELAKVLGKSPRLVNDDPAAASFQRRALMLVDRLKDLATELGGLKFALVWIKTPTRQLGGRSPLETLEGNDQCFAIGMGFIDDYLNAVPD